MTIIKTFIKAIFFVTACIVILAGCEDKDLQQAERNFKEYLQNAFKSTLVSEKSEISFYAINTNESEDCVDAHFKAIELKKFQHSTRIVIVGKIHKSEWADAVSRAKRGGAIFLIDEKAEGLRYDFGLVKPMVFRFKNARLVELVKIKDNQINSVLATL